MPKYSHQLIEETIKCFLEEDGLSLSKAEAVEVLENLAGLFLSFSDCVPGGDRPAPARAEPRVSAGARNTGSTLPNET